MADTEANRLEKTPIDFAYEKQQLEEALRSVRREKSMPAEDREAFAAAAAEIKALEAERSAVVADTVEATGALDVDEIEAGARAALDAGQANILARIETLLALVGEVRRLRALLQEITEDGDFHHEYCDYAFWFPPRECKCHMQRITKALGAGRG